MFPTDPHRIYSKEYNTDAFIPFMVLLVVGPKKTIRGDSMRIVAFNCVVERRVNLFVMSVYVKNKDHQYISFVLSIVQKA